MRGVSALLLGFLLCWQSLSAQQAPLMLVYQERVPASNPEEDPNLPIQAPLTAFLNEIRKVRVEWYQPTHPAVQQVLQARGLAPSRAEQPDTSLLMQVARAMGATYMLTVRCTNGKKGQIQYACTLWQLGRRAPLWQSEGIQQFTDETYQNALMSLLRTLAMRMNQEAFADLPTLPEKPQPPPTPQSQPPSLPADTPQKRLEQLIREGRLREAIAPLRTLINQEPTNLAYRLQLIQIYRQLGLEGLAAQAVDDALALFPDDETLLNLWARSLQESHDPPQVIEALQHKLRENPASSTLRLHLFDALLAAGRTDEAETVLTPFQNTDLPEVRWREYLLQGAKRRYAITGEPVQGFGEQAGLWWTIVSGAFTDFANEILDLRRLASDPAPNWKQLRERGEKLVQQILEFGQWVGRMQPDATLQKPYQHVRFGAQLLGQSAQHMARYLLSRNNEEAEQAATLRIEALRELESAQPKPE
ncbi:MAG: tetratricopeptide repeat protein [Armatimonadetes bacterium]|nr:tetratricopeptide repeat protein [Armatimonadota bacterium]CUU34084.1 hypothetical protein DCOP10_10472 [Armatimonadetes bacterium DC]